MKKTTTTLVLAGLLTASAASVAEASVPPLLSCFAPYRAWMTGFANHYIGVYSSRDTSRFDEVMAPDAINHNPFGDMDRAQLAATMQAFYVAFPDLTYQIEQIAIDGNRLVIEYTYTGTHLGNFNGLPPTGTVVHGRGLEINVLEHGKIVETFNYSDLFTLYAQLGLL